MKFVKYLVLVLLFSHQSFGKDLTNRLGVGFSNQFSVDLPSIMAMYYPNPETALSAALGINTEDDNSKFGLSFRYYRIIFPEDNLNFYMGGGGAMLSSEVETVSNSGFELYGFVGAEFFFPGLDSLSFRMETGLGIVSIDDGVTFRTIGDTPFKAGMTFYF